MYRKFKQEKTAKTKCGLCEPSNVLVDLQAQIMTVNHLRKDIECSMKKIGQKNNVRDNMSRRIDDTQILKTNSAGKKTAEHICKATTHRQL
jgi:hypothetical protein